MKAEPKLKRYVDLYEKNVRINPEVVANYKQRKAEFDVAIKKWNNTVGKEWDKAQKEWAIEVKKAQAAGLPIPEKPKPSSPRPSDPPKPNGGNNGPTNLFNARCFRYFKDTKMKANHNLTTKEVQIKLMFLILQRY